MLSSNARSGDEEGGEAGRLTSLRALLARPDLGKKEG